MYELFLALIDEELVGAPAGMQSAFAFTGREFVWMGTQESLVDGSLIGSNSSYGRLRPYTSRLQPYVYTGVFVGFSICFPVAFLVLLCATGSFRVAVFAIATIAAVVGLLLGFVAAFLGWELGTGEAIAATIVIGLSVDYTVCRQNLGIRYTHAHAHARYVEASATPCIQAAAVRVQAATVCVQAATVCVQTATVLRLGCNRVRPGCCRIW